MKTHKPQPFKHYTGAVQISPQGMIRQISPRNGRRFIRQELMALIGGGFIEIISTPCGRRIIMDDDGKFKDQIVNWMATDIYNGFEIGLTPITPELVIVGTVVICDPDMIR